MQKKQLPKLKKMRNELEEYAESEKKKTMGINLPIELENKIRKCASLLECATEDLNIIIGIIEG